MYKIYYTKKRDALWTIHDFFNELSIYMQDNYGAEVFTQFDGRLSIKKFNFDISDCEMIIHNTKEDSLKVINFIESIEYPRSTTEILKERNSEKDILVVLHGWGQYGAHADEMKKYKFSVLKNTSYTFDPKINYNYYYNLRRIKPKKELIDKLFWHCSGRGDCERLSASGFINERPSSYVPIDEYLKLAISCKAGLSIGAGSYEICHRDIDYMAIGLPLLRMEYIFQYDPELISNYHYIAVSREGFEKDSYYDLRGGDNYVAAYKKRFFEVKDDHEFLDFVSKNALDYYKKFSSPENRLKRMLEKLEIEK